MVRVSALPRLRCHIMTSSCLGFAERNRCTVTMASDCSVPFQPVRPDLTESLIATTVQMATGSTAATVTCTRLAPPTAGSLSCLCIIMLVNNISGVYSSIWSREVKNPIQSVNV